MDQSTRIIDANAMIGAHATHKLDLTPEQLVQQMDRHQVAASLVLSTVGVSHCHAEGNAITLETARANKRLVPVATVNPASYFGGESDMQAIRTQGFRIFKFYPGEQGWTISSAAFGEVLRQLAPLKVPVMLDAPNPGDPTDAARMVSGYPAPAILCSVSLNTLSEALAVMRDLPNVLIETHGLYTPGALELAAGRAGADRIVFGSGTPMQSVAGALGYVLNSDLSDEDKRSILGGNIRRILEAA